jgi:hypothetical protein
MSPLCYPFWYMVTVSCKRCKKKFKAKPSHVSYGFAKFCSKDCAYQASRTGKEVVCSVCAKKIYRAPRMIGRSKSGKYFCSKSCQTLWRNQLYVGKAHANYIHGQASYRSILGRNGIKKVCKHCKIKDERVIAVHHIDKNRKNNSVENLVYLCHNCHHLVHYHVKKGKQTVPMV